MGHFLIDYQQVTLVEVEAEPARDAHWRGLFRQIVTAAPTPVRHLAFLIPAALALDLAIVEEPVRPNHDALLFNRGAPPAAPQAGQPWYLWRPARMEQEPEEEPRRIDYGRFLFGRTAVEASGHFLFPQTSLRLVEAEEEVYRADYSALLFNRQPAPAAVVGHPFFALWPPARIEHPVEADPRQPDYSALLFNRFTPTVIGQPWYFWKPAIVDLSLEPEPVRIDHTRQILFGRTAPAAQPGQPWYFWKPPVVDLSVEPEPVRQDYTAMFFYRFEIVIPPELTGGEWIIRARRRRGR